MDGARHVIKRIFDHRLQSKMPSYDVASTVHQALLEGTGIGDYDRDGMAAKLFKQNYMSTDLRAWKD
jgi:hypothetical protein